MREKQAVHRFTSRITPSKSDPSDLSDLSDLSDNTLLPSWEVQYTLFVESYYKKSVKVRKSPFSPKRQWKFWHSL